MNRQNLFEYDNYRVYLRDEFAALKSQDKKFSLRYFARVAGFSSHNTLWNVIKGAANLSEESILKVSKALKHSVDERVFFRYLVLLNQAKSSELRASYAEEILRLKAYRKINPLKEFQLRYYSNWYYVVVREMVNLPDFQEDPEWIAGRTLPAISPRQAQEAIDELLKLGLLQRDKKGKLFQEKTIVSTGDEVTSALVAGFHREFLKRASEAIDLVPRSERDITSVTFRVSSHTAGKFKEKIQKFRKELLEDASVDPQPEAIYQLNLQLFPVTKAKNKGSDKP